MAKDSKKKTQLPKLMTPRGVFVWPKLTEPDYGTKDYPNPDGAYSLKLRLSQADADAFLAQKFKHEGRFTSLQELYDEAKREGERQFAELKVETRKKLKELTVDELYTVLYDKETEEPTGEVEFKFKMKASGEVKDGPRAGEVWTKRPDLFDASGRKIVGTPKKDARGNPIKDRAGKPVHSFPNIYGGSEGKVSFSVKPYFVAGQGSAGLSRMLNAVQIINLVSNGSATAETYGFGAEEGYGYDPEDDRVDGFNSSTDDDGDTTGGSSAGEDDF